MMAGNVGSRGASDATGASSVGGGNKTAVSAAETGEKLQGDE